MSALQLGLFRHLGVRTRAVVTDPGGWLALGFTSLAAVAFWPGLTGPDGRLWFREATFGTTGGVGLDLVVGVLWLVLWPVLSVNVVAGRAVRGSQLDRPYLALPALPVSVRGRMLAESLVVVGFVGVVRLLLLVVGGGWEGGSAATSTLAGAVLALPVVLAWTAPAVDESWRWAKPTAVAAAWALLGRSGALDTWPGLVAGAAILAVAVLVTANLTPAAARGRTRDAGPDTRVRPPGLPPSVLRHDLWAEPAARLGVWAAALVAAQLVFLVLDRVPGVPPEVFFFGSILTVSQIAALAMRPFGSSLLGQAFKGRSGSRPGDLAQAFAALPLRRESVLRAVWTHAFVATAMAWTLGVGSVAIRTYLRQGSLGLLDAEGQSVAEILLPAVAMIPAVAGFVAAAVSGRRRLFIGSGLALLGMLHLPLASLIVGHHLFGPGSWATPALAAGVLAVLCLLASLLPLPQLLGRRA